MQAAETMLAIVVLLGASLGHGFLLVSALNWWYAQPLHRSFLRSMKALHALGALAGPVLFVWVYGLPPDFGPELRLEAGWRTLLSAYVFVCAGVGLGLLPALSLARWLKGRPLVLLSNHTRTLDMARQLGYRPIGRGKYRHLALLPGNDVFKVDFAEKTFSFPNLPPALDGLSILHLSDLHFCGSPDRVFFQRVMDRCNEWQPDLVTITGDIVDSGKHHRWVIGILGRLRWRLAAYAVLGNHDNWHDPNLVRRRLRKLNIRVLGNGWERLEVRGQPIIVIGHEGPWFKPEPDLSNCPDDLFRLCLSHTPDNLPWGREQKVDLMLAGHNHGGQIRFPLLGSLFVPSRFGRRYDCGSFHEPPTVLHVSRGLGGHEPLRYLCRPEVTLVVLKKGSA